MLFIVRPTTISKLSQNLANDSMVTSFGLQVYVIKKFFRPLCDKHRTANRIWCLLTIVWLRLIVFDVILQNCFSAWMTESKRVPIVLLYEDNGSIDGI